MTDWQGHGWAGLHQHRGLLRRRVHSPYTHHSRPDWSCPRDCLSARVFFIVSFPVMGVLFPNQSHKSLYLPSAIKVKVCLGGTVAERRRQLTL